jgi:hypothetical protein
MMKKYKFDESTEWFFGTIEDQFREDEKMHVSIPLISALEGSL